MLNQEALKKLIDEASPYYERRRKWNQSLSIVVGLLGIGLSLGATISGIALPNNPNVAKIAAIFGACATTTQSILFAYPTEKRARTYRVLFAKNENLRTELEVRQQTEEELQKILEEFKSIRVQAALEKAVPRITEDMEEAVPRITGDTEEPSPSSLDNTNGHSPAPNGKAAATGEVSVPSKVSSNPPANF